jgi:RNA polymerase sigma factor CnrH
VIEPAPEDAALVQAVLEGKSAAERALVERHREAVYRIARTATGDPDEAYDITQEVFIAAFGALRRYDPARPFRAWIAAITLNKCRDWGRKRRVRRLLGLPLPDGVESWLAENAPLPDEVVSSRSELAATARAVAELPANLKDVLLLRTMEGLSQHQTATALGISEKAVEARLYRARTKLREKLRGNDPATV